MSVEEKGAAETPPPEEKAHEGEASKDAGENAVKEEARQNAIAALEKKMATSEDENPEEEGDAKEKDGEKEEVKGEEKEQPEEEKTPEKAEPQKGPTPPDDALLARAAAAGIPATEARTVEAGALEAAVRVLERRAQSGEQKQDQKAEDSDWPTLDPEEYDPAVIKAFDHMKTANQAMSTELAELRRTFAQQQSDAFADKMDAFLDGLDEDHAEFVGKGSGAMMDRESAAFKARDEVYGRAVWLAQFYASKQQYPGEKQLFGEAVEQVLGKKVREKVDARKKKELDETLARRRKQNLARATHRAGNDPADPRSKAIAAVAEKLKEF